MDLKVKGLQLGLKGPSTSTKGERALCQSANAERLRLC